MNQEEREQAVKILNKAVQDVYKIENLSSHDIWSLLSEYANFELWQIMEDLKK